MNKRILLSSVLAMAAIIFTFTSCDVSDEGGNDQGRVLNRALAIHNYTHFQSKVALDAADIAFKFNVYLIESAAGATDLSDKLYDMFGCAVSIVDNGNDFYTLTFPYGNLENREGSVDIYTGGKFLNDDGAEWELNTASTVYYRKSFPYEGAGVIVKNYLSEFKVIRTQNNKWTIDLGGSSSVDGTENAGFYSSTWYMDYTFEQLNGTQSYSDFTSADFKLEGESNYPMTTLFSDQINFAYKTTQYYREGCNRKNPQAGSVSISTLYDESMNVSTNPIDKVKYSWLNPEGTSNCTTIRRLESGTLLVNI